MNILLSCILALMIACVVAVIMIYRKISRTITQFITPEAENKPSPFALLIDSVASMFGRSIVAQLKSTLMGVQSGQKRAESAIEGDIMEGVVQSQSPMLGGLLNSFPALKKTLRRNPQLADMAMQFMANKMATNGTSNQSQNVPTVSMGGNGHSKVKFKL
jgi:hypothetical protein